MSNAALSAAIYARYSTDMQRDASIEDQIRLCEAHAKAAGWDIHQCYTDHGTSGASLLRPGIQMLLADAMAGKFQIIVAEALDRLSRDQEDIAGVYKRLQFAGVQIITLSEGAVSELHIGLKGTMNALFLKDLADKTRRGLRGRIEAGKSGGGKCYGYDVVKRLAPDGTPLRGDRKINRSEAAIVRRIFESYAAGESPKALARQLNAEGVPSPNGKGWSASSIYGNRQRGNGILNNELYIGRLVWNRLRFIKDPATGKRVPRVNPPAEHVVQEVPALRIIDDALWQKVKARQGEIARRANGKNAFWDRRRPRYLLSGLLKCGECGGSFVKTSHDMFGCAAARNKGAAVCSNKRRIKRQLLEETVLHGLRDRLMRPDLVAAFCEEYTRHRNELRRARNAQLEAEKAEYDKLVKEIDGLIQAILDGIPAKQVKDQIAAREARKEELQARLESRAPDPVVLHPGMADRYRSQVEALTAALNAPEKRQEAAEILRGLIERITLVKNETGGLDIALEGALAAILNLCAGNKKPALEQDAGLSVIKMVAGVGFEPTTFGL